MSKQGILYNFRRKIQVTAQKLFSYKTMTKIYYYIIFKRKINLKKPKYFNEKIHWLKLNYYPYHSNVIRATDKFKVREYLAEKNMSNYLNELYGVWESWEEVDWDNLPNSFALKCTHGARNNIIVDDKSKFDKVEVGKKITKWLKEDFSLYNAEVHYSKIKPRIICEKFLSGNMIDYKFFCFHGEPKFFYIASGFGDGEDEKMSFFNLDGTRANFKRISSYKELADTEVNIPTNLSEMIEISKTLSEDFPFVRVDLFSLEGKIYFSELTFTPSGGLMEMEPENVHELWGKYLDLTDLMKDRNSVFNE